MSIVGYEGIRRPVARSRASPNLPTVKELPDDGGVGGFDVSIELGDLDCRMCQMMPLLEFFWAINKSRRRKEHLFNLSFLADPIFSFVGSIPINFVC